MQIIKTWRIDDHDIKIEWDKSKLVTTIVLAAIKHDRTIRNVFIGRFKPFEKTENIKILEDQDIPFV